VFRFRTSSNEKLHVDDVFAHCIEHIASVGKRQLYTHIHCKYNPKSTWLYDLQQTGYQSSNVSNRMFIHRPTTHQYDYILINIIMFSLGFSISLAEKNKRSRWFSLSTNYYEHEHYLLQIHSCSFMHLIRQN